MKQVIDHLGNNFDSISDMCNKYDVTMNAYYNRIKRGWNLEKALNEKVSTTTEVCMDHLGKIFESCEAMCREYGVSQHTYKHRIKRGWSIEDALNRKLVKRKGVIQKKVEIFDHLGEKFDSIQILCDKYGVNVDAYISRIKRGWSLEKALMTKTRKLDRCKDKVSDDMGNLFNSVAEMCRHYNISLSTYRKRVGEEKLSIKEALLRELPILGIYDHKGIFHKSKEACAKFYGISKSVFMVRLNSLGYTIREAIVTPVRLWGDKVDLEVNDTSLNSLMSIHEYSHTQEWSNQRVFRCTVIATGDTLYLTEAQVIDFK